MGTRDRCSPGSVAAIRDLAAPERYGAIPTQPCRCGRPGFAEMANGVIEAPQRGSDGLCGTRKPCLLDRAHSARVAAQAYPLAWMCGYRRRTKSRETLGQARGRSAAAEGRLTHDPGDDGQGAQALSPTSAQGTAQVRRSSSPERTAGRLLLVNTSERKMVDARCASPGEKIGTRGGQPAGLSGTWPSSSKGTSTHRRSKFSPEAGLVLLRACGSAAGVIGGSIVTPPFCVRERRYRPLSRSPARAVARNCARAPAGRHGVECARPAVAWSPAITR